MRLLNVYSLEFAKFRNDTRPKYAIASHLWKARSEVTLQDISLRQNTEKSGYKKVMNFANYVKHHVPWVEWLWIDTCCVRWDSTAELSIAVNLMFDWYRNAELCIAYLPDVESADDKSSFEHSAWFKRGWTLQELLAPRIVLFVSHDWQVIGSKGASADNNSQTFWGPYLEEDIARITGIPEHVLHDFETSQGLRIDERLKWMEDRTTAREEDMSYALYGVFGVALGANYGEGFSGARQRLLVGIQEKSRWQNDFRYAPLADPRSETRILNILNTGEQNGPVRCSICHISLNDPPEYIALSYQWGDRVVRSTILITTTDGVGDRDAKFPATANLEAALREFRRRGISSIWADMICINQEDISERNQQVSIMGNIYAMATKVVAWTGPSCDGSSSAIRAMLRKDYEPLTAFHKTSSERAALTDVQGIKAFLSRPYFTRMWIIQELAKARVAEVWCGQDTMGLEDFNAFVSNSTVAKLRPIQETLFEALRLFRTGERQGVIGKPRMLLSQALVASRSSQASDPRDNIYALLGLTRDGNDVVTFPDYRRSVQDVFAAASSYMIGSQGQVSLILLARGYDNTESKPSWVPDWNDCTQLPPWIEECLRRDHDTWEFSSCTFENTLSVLGYLVDDAWEDLSQDSPGDAGPQVRVTTQERYLDMQDWLEKFMRDPVHFQSARGRTLTNVTGTSFVQPPSASRETALLALESGVQHMASYSMRLVRLKRRGFRMAHQDAKHGDQIWRLENCPLPVVLRPLGDDRFSFIGEVHADTRRWDWWESTWKNFDTPGRTKMLDAGQSGVPFIYERSKTIRLE